MKVVLFIIQLAVCSPIFCHVFDNVLLENPLPFSESGKINILKDLPITILEYSLQDESSELIIEYNLEYQIANNRLISHAINTTSDSIRGLNLKFEYFYTENYLEIVEAVGGPRRFIYIFKDDQLYNFENYYDGINLYSSYELLYNNGQVESISEFLTSSNRISVIKKVQWLNGRIVQITQFGDIYSFNYIENRIIAEKEGIQEYIWTYDERGKLIHEFSHHPFGSPKYQEHTFSYDEIGRLESHTHYQYSSLEGNNKIGTLLEFFYDESLPLGSELFDPRDLSDWEPSESEQDISSDQTIIENGETSEEVESDTNEGLSIVLYIGIAVLLLGVGLVVFFIRRRK